MYEILGAGENSSPQETKSSVSFSANVSDMRIPSQIKCNCLILSTFSRTIPAIKGIRSLNSTRIFSCQLHLYLTS